MQTFQDGLNYNGPEIIVHLVREIWKIRRTPTHTYCIGDVRNNTNNEYWGFDMLGKTAGVFSLAKSIKNLIPITLAVLESCKSLKMSLQATIETQT